MPHRSSNSVVACSLLAAFMLTLCCGTDARAEHEGPMPGMYDFLQERCVDILVDGRLDGSGSVIDGEGIVLTAGHVVTGPGRKIEVQSKALGRLSAEVIAVDTGHDLCLLKLPKRDSPYAALKLAAAWPEPATPLYLFGSPFFRRGVLMHGHASRKTPTYEYIAYGNNKKHFVGAMHITGMTPPGVSGGPWVNARGEVVGVQSGAMKIGGAMQGLAFAGPLAAVRELNQRRTHAETSTLDLAVEEIFAQPHDFIAKLPEDAQGVICVQVQEKGVGGTAGIREKDVLSTINGQRVEGVDWLLDYIRGRKPGETVRCVVFDSQFANPRELEVKLAHLEADWAKHQASATQATGSP